MLETAGTPRAFSRPYSGLEQPKPSEAAVRSNTGNLTPYPRSRVRSEWLGGATPPSARMPMRSPCRS
jgi:hypothetical protein